MGINAFAFLYCLLMLWIVRDLSSYQSPPGEFNDMGMVAVGAFVSLYFTAGVALVITWLPAVLDASIKSSKRYTSWNRKKRKTSIILAALFGPFGLLYTYHKDAAKFWISTVILLASFVLIPLFFYTDMDLYFRRILHGSMSVGQVWSEIQMGLPFYYFEYYAVNIKPVSFVVPALVWVSVIVSSIFRYRKRDNNTPRAIVPDG